MYDATALVMRAKYYIAALSDLAYLVSRRLTVEISLVQDIETGEVSFVFDLNVDAPGLVASALKAFGWLNKVSTPLGDTIINNLPEYESYAIEGNVHAEALELPRFSGQ